jgi:Signal transduction histidine kinase
MFKHGKISQVNFSISASEQLVKVTLSDDGAPFDFYQQLKSSKGIGLKSITTRLKQIGAILEQEQQGTGNTIILTLKKES